MLNCNQQRPIILDLKEQIRTFHQNNIPYDQDSLRNSVAKSDDKLD